MGRPDRGEFFITRKEKGIPCGSRRAESTASTLEWGRTYYRQSDRQSFVWITTSDLLFLLSSERIIFGNLGSRFGREEADIPLKAGDEWAADRAASGARYFPAYHPGQADPVPVRG